VFDALAGHIIVEEMSRQSIANITAGLQNNFHLWRQSYVDDEQHGIQFMWLHCAAVVTQSCQSDDVISLCARFL